VRRDGGRGSGDHHLAACASTAYNAAAQIAAIARFMGAAVAARNTADFEGGGVTVVDPWKR
jgi:hypothetical protein